MSDLIELTEDQKISVDYLAMQAKPFGVKRAAVFFKKSKLAKGCHNKIMFVALRARFVHMHKKARAIERERA